MTRDDGLMAARTKLAGFDGPVQTHEKKDVIRRSITINGHKTSVSASSIAVARFA